MDKLWKKDHIKLISHIFEILKINNLQIYNLQKLLFLPLFLLMKIMTMAAVLFPGLIRMLT